jgi:hypothetical protein
MATSEAPYRLLRTPYLWLTVMAAYSLFMSILFIGLMQIDQGVPSFYEPTEEPADRVTEYHPGGAGALPGLIIAVALIGGISLAALISIPGGVIMLIGKYRAAVPTMMALVIWALVWVVYVAISNSIIPVLGLIGTMIVIVLGIKGMKKIGDMS